MGSYLGGLTVSEMESGTEYFDVSEFDQGEMAEK